MSVTYAAIPYGGKTSGSVAKPPASGRFHGHDPTSITALARIAAAKLKSAPTDSLFRRKKDRDVVLRKSMASQIKKSHAAAALRRTLKKSGLDQDAEMLRQHTDSLNGEAKADRRAWTSVTDTMKSTFVALEHRQRGKSLCIIGSVVRVLCQEFLYFCQQFDKPGLILVLLCAVCRSPTTRAALTWTCGFRESASTWTQTQKTIVRRWQGMRTRPSIGTLPMSSLMQLAGTVRVSPTTAQNLLRTSATTMEPGVGAPMAPALLRNMTIHQNGTTDPPALLAAQVHTPLGSLSVSVYLERLSLQAHAMHTLSFAHSC